MKILKVLGIQPSLLLYNFPWGIAYHFFSLSIIDKYKQANSIKNRYRNVLPYDEHRVTLNQQPGDPFSDYINASYIDGYSQTHEFVAALVDVHC